MRIASFELLGDLKNEYMELRQNGQSRDQVVRILMARYHKELTAGAKDDGLLFWVALADAQYALKELSDEVGARGLAALEQLKVTIPEIIPGDIEQRRQKYACAPMPERSQIRKSKKFRCQWHIGDTFAYKMTGPEAETNGIVGDFVLIRKVDEIESNGSIMPVVTLTHWKNVQLPHNEVEFRSVPILPLCNGRFRSPKSTYEYRTIILFACEKQVKDLNLRYLGNFVDVSMPADEFYPREPGCVLMMQPKTIDAELSFYCRKLQDHYKQKK